MRPGLLALFLLGLLAGACVAPAPSGASTPTPPPGRVRAAVVEVIDGDTIRVLLGGKRYTVRYIGIDTPETRHPTRGEEPYGREATAFNRRLVEGRVVELEKDVSETDRFGRLLRYVYVDGQMVNAILVREGYAQAISYPPDIKHQTLFRQLQREAREARRGLWGLPAATTPSGCAGPRQAISQRSSPGGTSAGPKGFTKPPR